MITLQIRRRPAGVFIGYSLSERMNEMISKMLDGMYRQYNIETATGDDLDSLMILTNATHGRWLGEIK